MNVSPPGSDAAIEITGLEHSFSVRGSEVQALATIDLSILPGEFVCLAGPSGCGKTTLLRLIAGFMTPSHGVVRAAGREVRAPGPERGVVFQQSNLFPWLSVRDNVELGPKLRGVDKSARASTADHYLHLVGLGEFGEHRPYELSGGMQQRCQIARVLANDPEIVLMDEPFGALDAITRERLQNELLEIWRETRKTVVFITHSVDEAVFLGSRVMVMSPRPGRIVLDRSAAFSTTDRTISPDELRALPEFVDLTNEVREAIHETHAAAS